MQQHYNITPLLIMAVNEDFGSLFVSLAGEISSEIKRSMQDVGQGVKFC